jgi:hypothetical protein
VDGLEIGTAYDAYCCHEGYPTATPVSGPFKLLVPGNVETMPVAKSEDLIKVVTYSVNGLLEANFPTGYGSSTTLSTACSQHETSIDVAERERLFNANGPSFPFYIKVNNEIMKVVDGDDGTGSGTLIVEREQFSTVSPASHSNNSPVDRIYAPKIPLYTANEEFGYYTVWKTPITFSDDADASANNPTVDLYARGTKIANESIIELSSSGADFLCWRVDSTMPVCAADCPRKIDGDSGVLDVRDLAASGAIQDTQTLTLSSSAVFAVGEVVLQKNTGAIGTVAQVPNPNPNTVVQINVSAGQFASTASGGPVTFGPATRVVLAASRKPPFLVTAVGCFESPALEGYIRSRDVFVEIFEPTNQAAPTVTSASLSVSGSSELTASLSLSGQGRVLFAVQEFGQSAVPLGGFFSHPRVGVAAAHPRSTAHAVGSGGSTFFQSLSVPGVAADTAYDVYVRVSSHELMTNRLDPTHDAQVWRLEHRPVHAADRAALESFRDAMRSGGAGWARSQGWFDLTCQRCTSAERDTEAFLENNGYKWGFAAASERIACETEAAWKPSSLSRPRSPCGHPLRPEDEDRSRGNDIATGARRLPSGAHTLDSVVVPTSHLEVKHVARLRTTSVFLFADGNPEAAGKISLVLPQRLASHVKTAGQAAPYNIAAKYGAPGQGRCQRAH